MEANEREKTKQNEERSGHKYDDGNELGALHQLHYNFSSYLLLICVCLLLSTSATKTQTRNTHSNAEARVTSSFRSARKVDANRSVARTALHMPGQHKISHKMTATK